MRPMLRSRWWWPAVGLALVLCAGALAQSASVRDPGAAVALQALLNQGFEVRAATTEAGVQTLYLQKTSLLYACPLNVAFACGRVVSR